MEVVENSSRESFKAFIKKKINDAVLRVLTRDCAEKKKTSSLRYATLKPRSISVTFIRTKQKSSFSVDQKLWTLRTIGPTSLVTGSDG